MLWRSLCLFRGNSVFCVVLVLLAVNPRGSAPQSVASVSLKCLLAQELLRDVSAGVTSETNWIPLRSMKLWKCHSTTLQPRGHLEQRTPNIFTSSGIKAFGFGSCLCRTSSSRPVWAVRPGTSCGGQTSLCRTSRFCWATPGLSSPHPAALDPVRR